MLHLLGAAAVAARSPPVITKLFPRDGSKGGGTMITMEGSGFNNRGEDGDTVVFVGPAICDVQQYFSNDNHLVCETRPLHDSRSVIDSRVVMKQWSHDGATSALDQWDPDCGLAGSGDCDFQFRSDRTPYILRASSAITAGGSLPENGFVFGGYLRGMDADQYTIKMGDGSCVIRSPYLPIDEGDDAGAGRPDRSDVRRAERRRRFGPPEGLPQDESEVPDAEQSGAEPRKVMDRPDRDVTEFCEPPPGLRASRLNVTIHVAGRTDGDPNVGYGAAVWNELSVERHNHAGKYRWEAEADLVSHLYGDDEEAYTLTVLPEVVSVEPAASGANGGHTITVSGHGFAELCSENAIYLDGAECAITRCSDEALECTAAAMAAAGAVMGSAGVKVTASRSGVPFRQGTTINGMRSLTLGLRHGLEHDLNSGDNYQSTTEGLFVAPEDNRYRFWVEADDTATLTLNGDSAQQATPGAPFTLSLAAGQRVPISLVHTEGNGLDFAQANVDLLDLPASTSLDAHAGKQYHRVSEQQRITMEAPFRRQKTRITLVPADAEAATTGKCRFGAAGRPLSSWLSFNGAGGNSTEQIATATADAYSGCGQFGVTKAFNGTAYTLDFAFQCNQPVVGGVAVDFDTLVAECQGDWATSLSVVTQQAEEPVRGTVHVGIAGAGAAGASQVNWGNTAGFRDALRALPGVVDVTIYELDWAPYNSNSDNNKWVVEVRFGAPAGADMPEITVGTGALLPDTVTVDVEVLRNGEPDTRRYRPIPVEMLEVDMGPEAVARSSGITAACTDDDAQCAFAYDAALTPQVTSIGGITELSHGDTVVITGTGLVVDGVEPTVAFGEAECPVTAATATEVTCTMGHARAGDLAVRVLSPAVGLATVHADVGTVAYLGSVDAPAAEAWQSGYRGGSPVVLTGTGFARTPADNTVTIGGEPCVVTAATHTELTCIAPASTSAATTEYADLQDSTDAAVVIAAFATHGVQPTAVFKFSKAMTPSATAISPTQLSAALTATVEVELKAETATAFPLTGCAAGVALVSPSGAVRECTGAAFGTGLDVDTVSCRLQRGPAFPAAEQPETFVRVTLCAPRGSELVPVIAHPEPAYEHIDLAMRVESIAPAAGSLAGGATLVIDGAGFADEDKKIVRTALSYNYLEPMVSVAVSLADRVLPCQITSSNYNQITCILSAVDAAEVTYTTEAGRPLQLKGGGADGAAVVTVNDFVAQGCGASSVPTEADAVTDPDSTKRVLSGKEEVAFSGGGTASVAWAPVDGDPTAVEFTLIATFPAAGTSTPWNSYVMLEVLNPAYPDGGEADATICTANAVFDGFVAGLEAAPVEDTAGGQPYAADVPRAAVGLLSCRFTRTVAGGGDAQDYPLGDSVDTHFQVAVGHLHEGVPEAAFPVHEHEFQALVYGPSEKMVEYTGASGGVCEVDLTDAATPTLAGLRLAAGGTAVARLAAAGAQTLELQGTGFSLGDATVLFGDNVCAVTAKTDTAITCNLPTITAGAYRAVVSIGAVGYAQQDNVLFVSQLTAASVTPASPGSVLGGQVATIAGTGFNHRDLSANLVSVCGQPAAVLEAAVDAIIFVVPAQDTVPTAQLACDAVVNVTAELGGTAHDEGELPRTTEVATVVGGVVYAPAATPTIASVSPASGKKDDELTIVGAGFDGATDVWIGGSACAVTASTATQLTCTLGATPGGVWPVYVTVPSMGVATGGVEFTSTIEVTLRGYSRTGGFGGGQDIEIEGHGLGGGEGGSGRVRRATGWGGHTYTLVEEDDTEYGTHVTVCGLECIVFASAYDVVECQTPAFHTVASLQDLEAEQALPESEALTGVAIADDSGAELAFDNDFGLNNKYQSGAADCYVGVDFGRGVLVTAAKYYPHHQNAGAMEGGAIEVTADPTCQSGWTELASTDGATQGWNKADIADPVGSGTLSRCARYTRPSGGCTVTELAFRGYDVQASGDCAVEVVPTSPNPHPSAGPLVNDHAETGTAFTTTDNFVASSADTPLVTAVEPKFAPSVNGGVLVTITGKRFPAQVNTLVQLNGVACDVQTVEESRLTCLTGERGPRAREQEQGVKVCGAYDGCSYSEPTVRWRYLDRWSDPRTWLNDNIPLTGDTVVIPSDQTILVDVEQVHLNVLYVEGALVLDRTLPNINIDAERILVVGGLLEVGTEDEPWPWDHTVTITLHGDRIKSVHLPFVGTKVLAVADMGGLSTSGTDGGDELPEWQKGTLEVQGERRLRTWTRLEARAGGWGPQSGAEVRTRELVDFRAGEEVVITGKQEKATVASLTCSSGRDCTCPAGFVGPCGDVVTLTAPLTREHLATEHSKTDDAGNVFDLDMRPEIALLTRNVKIMGAGGPRKDGTDTVGEGTPYPEEKTSASQKFGCHTMAVHGGYYRMGFVEIENCGQAGVLGRYSTHLHVNGVNPAPKTYIHGNVMKNGFQRAVTIHSTDHSSVKDNVAYRIMGHTFFTEFGDELYNVMDNNIGIATLPSFLMLKSDMSPATFWTANPTNLWRNNVASDSSARGMWFELTNQGPTVEHRNNTFHHNSGIGFRNYPNYSPPSPQYFFANTYHNNGGNGLFYKKGGDNHHAYSKFARNGVDIFWKKYSTHNVPHTAPAEAPWNGEAFTTSRWIPNVRDCYFWGSYPEAPTARGSQALFMPQAEYFLVDGATFDGYKDAGVLSGCNGCCGTTNPKHGAFTFRFSRLAFRDSAVKAQWTCPYKQIFYDLDGTLTGEAGGTALPFYKFNEWAGQCEASGAEFDGGSWPSGGMVCNSEVRVRRLQIDNQEPRELKDKSLSFKKSETGSGPSLAASGKADAFGAFNFTKYVRSGLLYDTTCKKGNGASGNPKWDFSGCDEMDYLDWINYRRPVGEAPGWVAPIVTNHELHMDWDWHIDVQRFDLLWSRPFYLEDSGNLPLTVFPNEESVLLKLPYVDYRYQIPTFYAENTNWPLPYAEVDPETGESGGALAGPVGQPYMSRHYSFGSGLIFRNDSSLKTTGTGGLWSVAINPMNMSAIPAARVEAQGESKRYSLMAQAQQCAPGMCSLPGDAPITGPPLSWSDPATWQLARVEFLARGTQKGLEAQDFYDRVAADDTAVPQSGESVEIPDGMWIVLDEPSVTVDKLVVTGRLSVDWGSLSAMALHVDRLLVWGQLFVDAGNSSPDTLENGKVKTAGGVGSRVPADKSFDLVLHGVRTSPTLVATEEHFLGNKVAAVFGEMRLKGQTPSTAWTRLAATADATASSITVLSAAGWKVGDTVTVAPTEYPVPVDLYDPASGVDSIDDYAPHESEERTIAGINGNVVTLSEPLVFRHFAGQVAPGVTLAAVVQHMTRNVVVRGDLSDTPPGTLTNWYEGYGGHIVVGEVTWGTEAEIKAKLDAGESLGTVRRYGVLEARGVAFEECGKLASEHPCVQVRYFNELSQDVAPAFKVGAQRTVIEGSAFLHSWNHAVRAEGSNALTIANSNVYRGFKTQFEVWSSCSRTEIRDSTVVATMRSPDAIDPVKCARDNSCWSHPFPAVLVMTEDIVMQNNVAAGSDDGGFTFIPVDACGEANPKITGNEAVGTLVGHFALKVDGVAWDTAQCREVHGLTAWKSAHIGFVTIDQNVNLELVAAVLSDNHIGTSFNFVQDGIYAAAAVRDSSVLGSTAASTCGRSTTCLATSMGNERGLRCTSEYGVGWRRVGLQVPMYMNLMRTRGPSFYPPNEIFRMCASPWDNRFGNVEVQQAQFNVTGTYFGSWVADDCGQTSRAIAVNPSGPDFVPQIFLDTLEWVGTEPGAMMQLGDKSRWTHEASACAGAGCDAIDLSAMLDVDGTTFGRFIDQFEEESSKTVWAVSETAPETIDPARCEAHAELRAILCLNTVMHRLVFEANPERFVKRRLGPARSVRFPEGATPTADQLKRVDNSVGPFPQGCSCQKHFAQFTFNVEADTRVDLVTSGIIEDRNRISFFAPAEQQCIVAELLCSKPRPVKVSREDGEEIYPSLTMPTLDSPPGTNMLDPQSRRLYLTMCGGGDPEYILTYRNAVQVTFDIAVSIDEFFANDYAIEDKRTLALDAFIDMFTTLLRIPKVQVKVACVKGEPESGGGVFCTGMCCAGEDDRRRSDGDSNSTGYAAGNMTMVVEISPPLSENTTTVFNETVAEGTDSEEQEQWVDDFDAQLDEMAGNGTLEDILQNATGYAILALAVELSRDTDSVTDSSGSSGAAAVGAAVAVVALVAIVAAVVIKRKRDQWAAKEAPRPSIDAEAGAGALSFVRGSVHGPGAGLAGEASSSYDAKPSYFGSKNRAELQKDSLVVRKKKPAAVQNAAFAVPEDDGSYLDCGPGDVRASTVQHTSVPASFTGAQLSTVAPDDEFRPRVDTQWEL